MASLLLCALGLYAWQDPENYTNVKTRGLVYLAITIPKFPIPYMHP